MELNRDVVSDVVVRLRRVQGHVGGIIQMIESGLGCEDMVIQPAAAFQALHRAGFTVIAAGMRQCAAGQDAGQRHDRTDQEALERLFLRLA